MDAGLAKVEEKLHQAAALVHDLPFDRRFRAVSLASLVHALFYFTAAGLVTSDRATSSAIGSPAFNTGHTAVN